MILCKSPHDYRDNTMFPCPLSGTTSFETRRESGGLVQTHVSVQRVVAIQVFIIRESAVQYMACREAEGPGLSGDTQLCLFPLKQ